MKKVLALLLALAPSLAWAAPPNTTTVPTTLQNTPCTAVQLLYGAGASNPPACLNLGTGLSITTGTLNASGAVAGPGSSTSGDLAVWNNTSGSLLKDVGGSAFLDTLLGSTQGSVAYRNATVWTVLTPSTSGFVLTTQGASANPIWSSVSGGTGCTVTGGAQYQILVNNGSSACSSSANASVQVGALTLGTSGTLGSVAMGNATSGTITLQPVTGALGSVTASLPANTGTLAELNLAQTWTAVQTFTNSDVRLLGSSTGYTAFTSGNAGASNFTLTFPAVTDTLATIGTAQTWTAAQTFTNSDLLLLGSSTGATTFTSANSSASNYTITVPAATGTLALTANAAVASVTAGATSLTISPTTGAVSAILNLANLNTWTGTQTFNGTSATPGAVVANAFEPVTISATAATGTINYYVNSQSVLYYTSNASATWTVNLAFSAGTTMNTALATGQAVTAVFMVTQGGTAYYNTSVQVDGTTSGVTTQWQGGTAPSAGNINGIDVYTYTVIKTGSAAYTVLASQTQF